MKKLVLVIVDEEDESQLEIIVDYQWSFASSSDFSAIFLVAARLVGELDNREPLIQDEVEQLER